MFQSKSILLFGIKCTFIFLLLSLVGHHSSLGEKYARTLLSSNNIFLKNINEDEKIAFSKVEHKVFDTKIHITNNKLKEVGWYGAKVSTWHIGYLSTILLIALVLSTPFANIYQKVKALVIGIVLINIYVTFVLFFRVRYLFNKGERAIGKFEPSFLSTVADIINYITVTNIGLVMIMPVFVWLLVAFRKSDFDIFTQRPPKTS